MDANPVPSTSKPKKCFVLNPQARDLARHVLKKCEEEKQNKRFNCSINNPLNRAAFYTGLSKRTLYKLKQEALMPGPPKDFSRKGKKYPKKNDLNVDDYTRSVIHRCIEEFYTTKKAVPTCPKLLAAVKEKVEFPWGITSLRKLLKEMGYKWQKCHDKKRILLPPSYGDRQYIPNQNIPNTNTLNNSNMYQPMPDKNMYKPHSSMPDNC